MKHLSARSLRDFTSTRVAEVHTSVLRGGAFLEVKRGHIRVDLRQPSQEQGSEGGRGDQPKCTKMHEHEEGTWVAVESP